jgi:ketosteroid isomerase-like protein
MSSTADSKALVEQFIEAFNKDASGAVEEYLDDSGTWWVPGSLPISGTHPKAAMVEMLKGLLDAFETLPTLTIHAVTAEGDRVAVEAESHGKLKDGRIYNNFYHLLFVTRDGKLHQVKEYADTLLAYELFFAPPAQ